VVNNALPPETSNREWTLDLRYRRLKVVQVLIIDFLVSGYPDRSAGKSVKRNCPSWDQSQQQVLAELTIASNKMIVREDGSFCQIEFRIIGAFQGVMPRSFSGQEDGE
jgi:hypothetical protein